MAEPSVGARAFDPTPEARFRGLFENLPEALLVQAMDGTILEANPAAADLYGYEQAELVGRDARELVAGVDEAGWQQRIRLLEERGSYILPSTGVCAGGRRFPQEVTATRVDLGARPLALLLVRDLSERKRIELELASLTDLARLHEGRGSQREVADAALAAVRRLFRPDRATIVVFGADERIEWLASHEMDEFIVSVRGIRASQIPWMVEAFATGRSQFVDRGVEGRKTSALTQLADRLGFRAYAVVPVRAGEEATGAMGLIWNGAPPEVAANEELLTNVGRLVGLALHNAGLRDSLVSRSRELRESEERYRQLFEAAPDAILLVGPDGVVVDANAAAGSLYGAPCEELVGRPYRELVADDAEEWARRESVMRRSRRSTFRGVGRRLDGTTFPEELEVTRTSVGGGDHRLLMVRDLTDQERFQVELLQAQKMEAIGALVSGVAHELNNPLASIIAFSQLILRDERLPEDMRRDAELLTQEADRTRRIVQNLLDFARQRRPERREASLRDLVRRSFELHSYALGLARIETRIDIPDDVPPVDADASQILQVLLNLTNNAIDAIRSTGRSGLLEITARRVTGADERERVRLRISDDGPGVPPEVQPRLFEPFFTTKKVGEGTGLGLSVSYGIVASHGGRLWYEPRPGGGASFVLELPIHQPALVAAPPTVIPEVAADASTIVTAGTRDGRPGRSGEPGIAVADDGAPASTSAVAGDGGAPAARQLGAVVLAVDDEPSIRSFIRKALGRAGHEVTVAESGEQALELLERLTFDVMLVDHRMGGMDGVETYRRAVEVRPELAGRTIVMSGDTYNATLQSFSESSGVRLLPKPFDLDTLGRAVADVAAAGAEEA